MATVNDVREVIERAYPPHLAEDWDAVGLICGDPAASVSKVAFALDCTHAVAQRAVDIGAQMLVVHHPLLMRGVTSVAADTPKGKVIHTLIRGGVALMAAHTNADKARPGVNDVLAELVGITPGRPLVPADPALTEEASAKDAAGDACAQDAPALEKAPGLGRLGQLPEAITLREFTQRVANALPETEWGVRAAGDPDQLVRTVAVSSGSGDSFLETAAALGADVYLTSDLRHHPVDEHLRAGGPAVIDTAHWASEFPWTSQVRDIVSAQTGLETEIIELRTDPWTVHAKKEN
ncbi:Nif3-like dinuclear metal center hexameric protein [Corynebacterium lizhenjunii]|uniref:Nif3-like dinuclear metal center hexameric protein n=1 Tax=Corynebacterium lizhenjunii TaxID=2709394 RepID=UPI0013EDF9BD|nr:Nif3-like dinuclear metal center hexameric protein [Corynebacterium lizhenjunii]